MSTPIIEREELSAVLLNATWWLDVNTGTPESPTWVAVNGIYDFKGAKETKTTDVSDFSSDGWSAEQAVGKSWAADCKVWRKPQRVAAQFDPGQEFLRLHDGENVEIRYYEMGGDGTSTSQVPRVEAYQGFVSVGWGEDGGKHDDPRSVSVALKGQGRRNAITHPYPNSTTP